MYNILTLNKIAACGLNKLGDNYAIGDNIANPDGVIVRSASMHEMEMPATLKAIARAGAGTNNIPVEACAEKGIVVFNTPGANANAVKELVICALLLASRDIIGGAKWADTLKSEGDAVGKLVEKGKSQFAGNEIKGKTLGVIGLGAIGVMVANAAKSLGMDVLGYDPYISVDAAWSLSRSIVHVNDIKEIFTKSDFITIHVPLNDATKNTIDEKAIALMKDGVKILNFSRNGLCDNEALIKALEADKVSSYVTDFPSADMIGVKNVICLPHLGASTEESEDNCAILAANEIKDFLENGNIVNSVNYPNCYAQREFPVRICIAHKNAHGILSKISNAVSEKGLNIENLINKSKGDFAYTIVDLNNDTADLEDTLKAIEGTITVRTIK